MSPKLLYWHEVGTVGKIYTEIDRWCSYFDFLPVAVDCIDAFKGEPGQYPIKVASLAEAHDLFSDHAWVFLHSEGATILDEFEHPPDPVLYAVGSNITGFSCDVCDLEGSTVRLRDPQEIWDYQVAQMLMYDRQLYLDGRRVA